VRAHAVARRVRRHGVRGRLILDGGGHRQCKRGRGDHRLVAEQRDTFDDISQLAHVPGPFIGGERRPCIAGECFRGQTVLRARPRQKLLGKLNNVRAALPKRRQLERQHSQTVVEILAEAPFAHRLRQILVRRGDEPHIDRFGARAAQAAHGTVFQDLQ
jgi:hypothetical protein